MPELRVRASTREQRFRLQLRPSVGDLLVRQVVRLLTGWWRELVVTSLVVGLDVYAVVRLGGWSGHLFPVGLGLLVLGVPWSRRLLAGWLAAGRVRRRWSAACRACELGTVADSVPRVRRVRWVPAGVRLAVQVRPGQSVADLVGAGPKLAACLAARDLRVEADAGHAGRATVTVVFREPMTDVVAPVPLPERADGVDLDRLPVGRTETGGLWLLPLRGSHVLVAGATGSGKGSVLWSLVRSLAPAVSGRLVEVWAVDPKGGMELGFGQGLFARFATDAEEIAELLEAAVELLRERARRLRGVTRLHVPTVGDPLVVLVVDEIASLTAYLADKELRRRVDAALGLLLSQGRAVGVVVVGAVQDPRKEVLPLRGLFPVRVALRTTEASQVDLVLGAGAHARGATAEKIPVNLPGVGFAGVDGQPDPVRVRACHVSDTEIAAVAARYPAPAPVADPAGPADPDTEDSGRDDPPPPVPVVPPLPASPPPGEQAADLGGGRDEFGVAWAPDVPLSGFVGGWTPDVSAFRPPGAVGPLLPESVTGEQPVDGADWEEFAVAYRRRHRLDDHGQPLPEPGDSNSDSDDGDAERGGPAPDGPG